MKIASVIVDVPTIQTDRPFDYLIPEQWEELIQKGMRVIVPFGGRYVQGFIIDLKSESNFAELKEISKPMDVTPVLNEELLHLGNLLAEKTLCLKISAYQVMLPPALKGKYEKYIVPTGSGTNEQLPEPLLDLISNNRRISWNEAEKIIGRTHLYTLARKNLFEVIYEVKSKGKKKTVDYYRPAVSLDKLNGLITTDKRLGSKQRQIIRFFLEHFGPHAVTKISGMFGEVRGSLRSLEDKGILKKEVYEEYRDPYQNRTFQKTKPLPLTEQQEKAIGPIFEAVNEKHHNVFLLYGVTGSGKTEVYMQSIDRVIKNGQEAIVLVPEISLTPQMVARFKGRFGDKVAVLHSRLSIGEKYDEWRKIQKKEVQVVVGARSAIFAPFENLGIIIIDEEHEQSYKQEETPRYHARDVAIERGKIHSCPVVLGSATPSLESMARAQKKVYELLTMEKRMNDKGLPTVDVVDMREELRDGNRSIFSRQLLDKMKEKLEKREQIVLLLNRRGYSTFVMCRDCGYVARCPNCDISLTYHKFQNLVKCHYCGYEAKAPNICPECGSKYIRFFGSGTQKVEEELGKMLPEARVLRMDVDTTRRKGSHEKILRAFKDQKADILLGTQMIAKGLDFPNITLVGVLSADTSLHIPDFRASEKTFQLLTQVSGRAGRDKLPGEVIVQTYTPEHYSIQFAKDHDFLQFYQYEMMVRKQGQYPPFYYLVLIQASHENLPMVISVMDKISVYIRSQLSPNTVVLGPAPAPIARVKNKYRYQCMIKYKREPDLIAVLQKVLAAFQKERTTMGLTLTIDLNPYSLM